VNRWTPEEDKILKENYEKSSKELILSKLPHRVWRQVYKRSVILGLYRPEDGLWTESDDSLLKETYASNTHEFILSKFPGRTWKAIRWRANNIFGLIRDENAVQEENKKTNQKVRGTDYPTQSEDVRAKVIETVREKYGVDNVFQSKDIQKRITEKNIEKFGCKSPLQNPEIMSNLKKTNFQRYGVENTFQLTDRVKEGMIRVYGEAVPLKVPEIMGRKKETSLKVYGFECASENPEVKKKVEATNLVKYGFKSPSQNETIKERIKATNLSKYKVSNPMKVAEIKQKVRDTTFERHGIECFLMLKEVRDKARAAIKANKSTTKSKEEIKFMDYLKLFDEGVETHIEHPITKNVIDYYMPKFDLWIQFDGVYWHGKIRRGNVTKQSIKIQRTIEIDKYQNEHILNLIRFWSDDVKEAIDNGTIMDLIESKIIEKTCISHQYLKKQEHIEEDKKTLDFDYTTLTPTDFDLANEPLSHEIVEFIIKYEWLGTIGVIPKWCFTARYKGKLGGVLLINEPTAYSKLLGDVTPRLEALIQRGATASWTPRNLGSRMIMFSCNWMVDNTDKRLFVAYCDPRANEMGVLYSACNFDYLGNNFGTSYLYKHNLIKDNKWFSPQSLKRTSAFKKWCKNNNIPTKHEWFKDNGFKDLKFIPKDIKDSWYAWNRKILLEAQKLKVDKKHKYAIVLGRDNREKEYLKSLRAYKSLPYPKYVKLDPDTDPVK
jgi:hypothetical protein